jgi:hypothetical protein
VPLAWGWGPKTAFFVVLHVPSWTADVAVVLVGRGGPSETPFPWSSVTIPGDMPSLWWGGAAPSIAVLCALCELCGEKPWSCRGGAARPSEKMSSAFSASLRWKPCLSEGGLVQETVPEVEELLLERHRHHLQHPAFGGVYQR